METKGSLLCLQDPPQRLGLPSGLLLAFPKISYMHSSCSFVLHVHLTLPDLIILIILGEESKLEAPYYAVSSNLLALHLPSVHLFSAPCFQTLSLFPS
jgi:hypothetical protein